MKALLTVLCFLPLVAIAEPLKVPFSLPESFPFSVSLILPESSSVASRKKTDAGDSIRARVGDSDSAGMLVEISDSRGNTLWSHDFGYNLSASEGNEVEIIFHPESRLLLINYQGYKWDHSHKLLFVEPDHKPPTVREYSTAEKDILPLLTRQKDFPADYKYWIYPLRFTEHGVEFQCIPIEKPSRKSVHPLAQDQPWYLVTTTVDIKRTIVPTDVKTTH